MIATVGFGWASYHACRTRLLFALFAMSHRNSQTTVRRRRHVREGLRTSPHTSLLFRGDGGRRHRPRMTGKRCWSSMPTSARAATAVNVCCHGSAALMGALLSASRKRCRGHLV